MGGWGVPKSGRGIYMLDTWNPGKFEHPKDLDHPHEVKDNLAPSKVHYTCPTWSWGVAGWLLPECFNNYIIYQCMYIYIYIHLLQHSSIHPFHLQSNSHSTTPQATNIFNPLFDLPLTMQPSNSRSPLLTELLEDNARLRWRPFRSCRVLEKTGQSRVMWPIICCFVREISVV